MKNYRKITKNIWDSFFQNPDSCGRYPNESVIRFLFRNFKRSDFKNLKILDHGCGAGRHLCFLAEQGVKSYGIDVSKGGISASNKVLKKRKGFLLRSR
ncbi:MAG: class I SAM-dependent methyltransferase [Candidatus Pacebacteria bacterium]|nr:class I SAM-dependent methyltransferase [Candidatus Paceibacterota bacterium]